MTDEQLTEIWKGLATWAKDSAISPILLTFGRAVATAAVEAERKKLKQSLQDPEQVHVAMLRGEIATPSIRAMLHVHGEKALETWAAGEEAQKATPEDRAALAEAPVPEVEIRMAAEGLHYYAAHTMTPGTGMQKAATEAVIMLRRLAASPPPLQPAQPVVPEDWQLVPKEPTEAMWDAGRDPVMYRDMNFYRPAEMPTPAWQINPDGTVEADRSKGTTAVHVWRAMIAAAQQGEKP